MFDYQFALSGQFHQLAGPVKAIHLRSCCHARRETAAKAKIRIIQINVSAIEGEFQY
jgi:hypothetical protein